MDTQPDTTDDASTDTRVDATGSDPSRADVMEHARERLLAERERVESLIEGARPEFDEDQTDSTSSLSSVDQHPADQATETFERTKDLAILESLEAELAEIEAALARVDDGSYGIDEQTGELIDPARLDAMPTARGNITPTQAHGGDPARP